jgi:hypothetical protein
LESFEFKKKFGVSLAKFENNQILFNKFSHIFLVAAKLFTGRKILIVASQTDDSRSIMHDFNMFIV